MFPLNPAYSALTTKSRDGTDVAKLMMDQCPTSSFACRGLKLMNGMRRPSVGLVALVTLSLIACGLRSSLFGGTVQAQTDRRPSEPEVTRYQDSGAINDQSQLLQKMSPD